MTKFLQATAAGACIAIAAAFMCLCLFMARTSAAIERISLSASRVMERSQQDIRAVSIRVETLLRAAELQINAVGTMAVAEVPQYRVDLSAAVERLNQIAGVAVSDAVLVGDRRAAELVASFDGRLGSVATQAVQAMRSVEPALVGLAALEAETTIAVRETKDRIGETAGAIQETAAASTETLDELRPRVGRLLLDARVITRGAAKNKIRWPWPISLFVKREP